MGCSGVAAQGHNPNQRKAPTTIAEALKRGEESGVLPKLDRSASIAGPDADGNGVRDDLDAYIDSLPDTSEQKKALRQGAKAMAAAMTANISDADSVREAARKISDSVGCFYLKYETVTARNRSREIEKYSVNTKERLIAYSKFNSALNGASTSLNTGDVCVD